MNLIAAIWGSLIVAQLALLFALVGFIIRFAILIISRGFDVPFVRTPRKYFPMIADALNIRPHDVVYDLGSGEGKFVLFCAKKYPDARFVGIERNFVLYFQALARKKFAGNPANVTFRRENFFTTNLSDATRLYAYLLPKAMERLFSDTPHPGLRVASRAFHIKRREPIETIELSAKKGWHNQHLLHIYEL
jgi:hypothetical protein